MQVKLSEVCDKYCLHSVLNFPLGITISCMVYAYMLAYACGLLRVGHLFRGYCVYICMYKYQYMCTYTHIYILK